MVWRALSKSSTCGSTPQLHEPHQRLSGGQLRCHRRSSGGPDGTRSLVPPRSPAARSVDPCPRVGSGAASACPRLPVEVDRRPVKDQVAHRGVEPPRIEFPGDRPPLQGHGGQETQVQVVDGRRIGRVRHQVIGDAGFEWARGILLRRRVRGRGDVRNDQADGVVGVRLAAELAEQVDQPACGFRLSVESAGTQPVEEPEGGFGVRERRFFASP